MKTIAYPTNVLQNLNLVQITFWVISNPKHISEVIKRKLEPVCCKKRQNIVPDQLLV